jgi:hypothetical protein
MIPARVGSSLQYYHWLHKFPNLRNPQTFNEKLLWLKIYDHNPDYIPLVDKYEVKRIIGKKIGEGHIIPTLGIWDSVDAIGFDSLPNQFVLKCTHDSGSALICKDKSIFDVVAAQGKLSSHLKRNFYYYGYEWPYKYVKPRIIAEKYLQDKSGELRDYKFFCFSGKVKLFKIDFDRFLKHRANYYDAASKQILPFGEVVCPPDYGKTLEMPEGLDQMIDLAGKLSTGYPFLRVDFYSVDSCIYFGELTFFPASGIGRFTSEEWDYKMGSWIELPEKRI